MTDHSYVGSTPSVAAAQNPAGLETIVPSAGLASMYDHQFQAGVPYFLQWAGPKREEMLIDRPLQPGDYRIEVHNWAGLPGDTVRVTAVFRDSQGVAGT